MKIVRIDEELHQKLKVMAAKQGVSLQELVLQMIHYSYNIFLDDMNNKEEE